MPAGSAGGEPWDRTSRPRLKGNIVIALLFIAAVITVFGLLAAAYGADTRDGFHR